ncbi:MAG: 50S ribosomal protein L13 [Candidatus Krumholzibacteria bacterium]|nr:50S ribosomal protein L13 [Candidatus Krumholzibacteria bacterium]
MQKTTVLKPEEYERKWFVVDADGKTLGRLATRVATVLRGKHKPGYVPYHDLGDFVVVVNASKVHVTGAKREQKTYWRYTGYPSGLRLTKLKDAMDKDPTFAVTHAIKGMLPHNKLGRRMMRKLKVYAGGSHPHAAQKPEELEL